MRSQYTFVVSEKILKLKKKEFIEQTKLNDIVLHLETMKIRGLDLQEVDETYILSDIEG